MNGAVDIVVVGAGSAGIAAAVGSARAGCSTLLLEQQAGAGGIGGFSGLTTLCGLYDDAGNFLNEGFAREFAEALQERRMPIKMGRVWVLPYRPEKFREVAARFLSTTPKLQTRWQTAVQTVSTEGQRITSLNGMKVGAVIDCSGTAEVARAIGAECLATDESTQASAIVFPLQPVTREFKTPADVAQVLLPLARAGFPPLNFQPGLDPGTLTLKFTGDAGQVRDLIQFLRANIAGFENCSTSQTEFVPTPRAR